MIFSAQDKALPVGRDGSSPFESRRSLLERPKDEQSRPNPSQEEDRPADGAMFLGPTV